MIFFSLTYSLSIIQTLDNDRLNKTKIPKLISWVLSLTHLMCRSFMHGHRCLHKSIIGGYLALLSSGPFSVTTIIELYHTYSMGVMIWIWMLKRWKERRSKKEKYAQRSIVYPTVLALQAEVLICCTTHQQKLRVQIQSAATIWVPCLYRSLNISLYSTC